MLLGGNTVSKKPISAKLIYKLTQLQFPEILCLLMCIEKKESKPGIVMHTYNSRTSEAKGGGLYVTTLHFKNKN